MYCVPLMAGQFRARMPPVGTGLEEVAVEDVIVLVVGLVDKMVVEEPADEDMSACTLLFFWVCVPDCSSHYCTNDNNHYNQDQQYSGLTESAPTLLLRMTRKPAYGSLTLANVSLPCPKRS